MASYLPISLLLNILLTLMIIVRLALHIKNNRSALVSAGATGLYVTVITIVVESSALYAVTCALYMGPWAANSFVADIFAPVLSHCQVRGYFPWCLAIL